MRSGYENGYQVITLSDCVAATSPEEHDNAMKYDYPMFSDADGLVGLHRGPPGVDPVGSDVTRWAGRGGRRAA